MHNRRHLYLQPRDGVVPWLAVLQLLNAGVVVYAYYKLAAQRAHFLEQQLVPIVQHVEAADGVDLVNHLGLVCGRLLL